jgi:hypothetical protein
VAGGLTIRQVKQLLEEHGSYDAAIDARPDLADDLRSVRKAGERLVEQFRPVTETYSHIRDVHAPAFSRPPKVQSYTDFAEAGFERDVRVYETALERHEAKRRVPQPPKVEPDLTGPPLPAGQVLKALQLFARDESAREVERQTGLSHNRRALRVKSWADSETVWWDSALRKLRVGTGYALIKGGTEDEPTLRLIRT